MGYLGAKSASGAYQAVIAQMPPHDTYIETHLGSGVVLHRKPPAPRSIGLELDPDTLAAFAAPYPVELHNVDCLAFLRTFDFATAGRVLIYADPPYVLASRTGPDRYRFDYTDADHCELVALLRTLPAMVLLSGYPSALPVTGRGKARRQGRSKGCGGLDRCPMARAIPRRCGADDRKRGSGTRSRRS